MTTYIQRLGSQHLAVCRGRRVLSIHVTRRAARRSQRRINYAYVRHAPSKLIYEDSRTLAGQG